MSGGQRLKTLLSGALPTALDARGRVALQRRRWRRSQRSGWEAAYVREHGLAVRRGPFVGLRYERQMVGAVDALVAKLVGAYEAELHSALRDVIGTGPRRVVDVGAAEGYYAVGLAITCPEAVVYAFDENPLARKLCELLAAANGVADRVIVGGRCTPAELDSLQSPDFVLSDCEGCEAELFTRERFASLRRTSLLIELHDFLKPGSGQRLGARARPTHKESVVASTDRAFDRYPELDSLGDIAPERLIDERRPGPMRWLYLSPREDPGAWRQRRQG